MSHLRFDQLSLQFPHASHPTVLPCSLEIQSGEFIVILGPSGCGKTTLLKMVNRLYTPTTGRIFLDGIDTSQLQATSLRRQMGYVIQQTGLFPHMTVAQNIGVVPKLLGWSGTRIQARIDELLTLVQLSPPEYRSRYPRQLSGGQQQRVGLARALAGDPPLLLMDEPFGALDAITRTTLQTELLHLHRSLKKTILFVSHDVEEALRLADRILILQNGAIVQFDTPFQLLINPANRFVQDLLGTDDLLRRLGFVPVTAVMKPAHTLSESPQEWPAIDCQANLRQALSLMLQTGQFHLMVTSPETILGAIGLAEIRQAIGLPPSPPSALS